MTSRDEGFTDTGLRLLKEAMKILGKHDAVTLQRQEFDALLHRLEAAERIARSLSGRIVHTPQECFDVNPVPVEDVKEWLRSKGEGSERG